MTGAVVAAGFWGWIGLAGNIQPIWTFDQGVATEPGTSAFGGWLGLGLISVVSGFVSGVAEALGSCFIPFLASDGCTLIRLLDLGSLDDNLTLPIISGGCLWGFFKCLKFFA